MITVFLIIIIYLLIGAFLYVSTYSKADDDEADARVVKRLLEAGVEPGSRRSRDITTFIVFSMLWPIVLLDV